MTVRISRHATTLALGALALCVFTSAGAAQASTVRSVFKVEDLEGGLSSETLHYFAAPGENNRVTLISQGGAPSTGTALIGPQGCQGDCGPIYVVLRDTGARITPGRECVSIDRNTVRCGVSRDSGIRVLGGDRADVVDARPLAGSPEGALLSGGPGNDLLLGKPGDKNDLRGDSGADRLIGADKQDFLVGGPGNDHVEGRAGEDQLFGSDGNDALLGGVANDEVKGGKGNDRIVGGRGIDKLDGGPGRDRINSLDAHRERVLCGTGFDSVRRDRKDRLFSCERARPSR